MIKALQELCQTPLYKSARISIRLNLKDIVELVSTNETIGLGKKNNWCNFGNLKKKTHLKKQSRWKLHWHIIGKYFKS